MKREPSIHITRAALKKLTKDWFEANKEYSLSPDTLSSALVSNIFFHSRKYSLRHRSLLESNKKIAQRTSKIKLSSKEDALVFAKLYVMIRRKLKHQVQPITEKSGVLWDYVNQAAGLARSFSNDFELDFEEAVQSYIMIALSIIKPFSINKFRNADERIRSYYETYRVIENDDDPERTQLIYELYQAKVAEKTGFNIDYKEQPQEYVHFVEAAKISKELGVHSKYFITAQFEQLDWTNGYPSPSQLSSFKARERAVKWMTENQITMKKQTVKRNKFAEEFMQKRLKQMEHENNSK